MRFLLTATLFVVILSTSPATAQLRDEVPSRYTPARLYDTGGSAFTLNKLFSPQHFRMGHSVEMSVGSFGGETQSLTMYTNSLMWQFGPKLAARADVSVAYSPFGNALGGRPDVTGTGAKVFLRNAEIAYRPTERTLLHLSVRQSPFGPYARPYGYRYYPY